MRKIRLLSPFLIAIAFITVSCTKEGPEGPAGATGAQGPAGAAGTPGAAGAGVTIYSTWFVTGTGWTATGADVYGADFLYNKAAPSITQDVIDKGVILAYMKGDPNLGTGQASQVFQLAYSVGHPAGYIDTYDYVLNAPGNIRFLYKTTAPFYDETDLAVVSYRYIAIAGSQSGKNTTPTFGGFTIPQLKAMPYEQVLSTFNIPAEGTNIR